MPNKIRLCTGQEFDLVGYGMMKDDNRHEIQFRFSSPLGIGEVQTAFKDATAIERLDYLLADGTIRETITDCAAYQSITQDSEGKYIVTLSTDKVSAELKNAKEALQFTQEELIIARGELDSVKGELQAAQTDLQTTNTVLNTMLTEVIPQIIELVMPAEEPVDESGNDTGDEPEEDPEEIPEE
ncbi:hypothetical protein HNQ56_003726 [Anaerotaenia torta]|uniref:hypothetical protein n=1 Tax=Anaerotaenia torta TaxID=433293 RepID=UPI003D22D337